MVDRRSFLMATLATLVPTSIRTQTDHDVVSVKFGATGGEISSAIFGSNELGTMDGRAPSVSYDQAAAVTFRRLGGNLMSGYNWVNNAANAGHDWEHQNSFLLTDLLDVPAERKQEPAVVIETMHRNSLRIGARSVITLPLAGYVAADGDGPVKGGETAPSPRFVPVRWSSNVAAGDPIDHSHADISQLLRRLIDTFGPAGTAKGITGYILDNEPGLWSETHPRIVPTPASISTLLKRSIEAAKVIKSIDPKALVFGPASWGVTEFQSFQNAPDWSKFSHYESFIAAYLAAFREASEQEGVRLLDVLDVHWYPQSYLGGMLHTNDERFANALLAAPRSLSEPGFQEESWITNALPVDDPQRLSLPILPSLSRLIDQWFPGTELAVMEYNFGGPRAIFSGLAVADALGRMATWGVKYAAHWGNVEGWIAEAFRLFRDHDGLGGHFSGLAVQADCSRPDRASVYAARNSEHMQVVIINKGADAAEFRLPSIGRMTAISGFDEQNRRCGPLPLPEDILLLPGRSARIITLV